MLFWPHKDMEGFPGWVIGPVPGLPPRQHKHERRYTPTTLPFILIGRIWKDYYDGQMIFGDLVGLKLPEICLIGEEKPQKTSPRKLVLTGDRTRACCMTGTRATACSTMVDIQVSAEQNWLTNQGSRIEREKSYPGTGLEPEHLYLCTSALTIKLSRTSTNPW